MLKNKALELSHPETAKLQLLILLRIVPLLL